MLLIPEARLIRERIRWMLALAVLVATARWWAPGRERREDMDDEKVVKSLVQGTQNWTTGDELHFLQHIGLYRQGTVTDEEKVSYLEGYLEGAKHRTEWVGPGLNLDKTRVLAEARRLLAEYKGRVELSKLNDKEKN